ncbi:mannonate oxidoreductase [Bacteroidia bacterium]|nr:mannonate oxidoreductase [Bacteroidia bacterium]
MIKIGDKVWYLNSVGGGTVQKFIDKTMVSVLEDDGFETPVFIKECVVVEGVNEKTNFPSAGKGEKNPAPTNARADLQSVRETGADYKSAPAEEIEELFEETPEGEKLTVALAFVPQELKKIQDTDFDLYLVNDSNYSLYYSISTIGRGEKSFAPTAKLIESGLIHLNTTLFLREIAKSELNDYEQLNVQFVAFKETKTYDVKPAVSLTVKLKLVNFYKLHSFAENDYFDEEAMVLPIITQDTLELPLNISADDFNLQQIAKKDDTEKKQPLAPRRPTLEKVVVDLHIRELLDNTNGLPPVSLFEYQMTKFRETLAEHKNNIGQQIVFIHGKGNGVLRKEIIKEIHAKYPAYKYQDASFREYGFGATMITIRQERKMQKETE